MSTKWERRFGWMFVYFPVIAWVTSLVTALFDVAIVPMNRRVSTAIMVFSFSIGCVLLVLFGGQMLSETGKRIAAVPNRVTSTA